MDKAIKIMASTIGIFIVLISLVIGSTMFFGVRTLASMQKEPEPDVRIETETELDMNTWIFQTEENSEISMILRGDFVPYGATNMDMIPENIRYVLNELDLGYVSEAQGNGVVEVWVTEDEKATVRLVIRNTGYEDYEENDVNLNFQKFYMGTAPLQIAYETTINGVSINVDFVADNVNEAEAEAYEILADNIINTMEFTLNNTYIDTTKGVEGVVRKPLFAGFTNVIAIILIINFGRPFIKAVKKIVDNDELDTFKRVFTTGEEMKNDRQNRNSRAYDKDDEVYGNHTKDLGKDYSSQKPQIYNQDKYVVDNSRYKYGMDMSMESKRKKQEQFKSMLESGMIEKDEYNEKMKEVERQYR